MEPLKNSAKRAESYWYGMISGKWKCLHCVFVVVVVGTGLRKIVWLCIYIILKKPVVLWNYRNEMILFKKVYFSALSISALLFLIRLQNGDIDLNMRKRAQKCAERKVQRLLNRTQSER